MENAAVIDEIRAAFRTTVLPASELLTKNHCSECIDTFRLFWDTPGSFMTWESAAAREGACMESALLTPTAWRYYLPAMLIWCVRDTAKVDALVDNLVYELTPKVGVDGKKTSFDERAPGFSTEQRRAITAFLEWCQQQEEAEWASIGGDPPREADAAIAYWSVTGTAPRDAAQ
jgi:hypothetical protein